MAMNDTDNRIFEPDVTLSGELLPPNLGLPEPERMLMIAVLEDAAHCLLKSCTATVDRKLRALYAETDEWFRSPEHTELYAYENVCAVLGIDADWLRRRLFRLVDERRATAGVTPVPDDAAGDPPLDPLTRAAEDELATG